MKDDVQAAEAVVVGLCAHGLAIARSLHHAGIKVHALEQRPDIPGSHTKLAHTVFIDSYDRDYLIERLRRFAEEKRFAVPPKLFLTNDDMVRSIAERWPELEGLFQLSWASCRHKVLELLDKRNLEAVVREKDLQYPKTWIVGGEQDLALLRDTSYPIVIKPSKPLSSFKAEKVLNADAAIALVKKHRASAPFIAQTWIPGNDEKLLFCALYYRDGKVLASFEGRKIRSLPRARGQTTVAEPMENKVIRHLTERFFEGYITDGPVSLEFKVDDLQNHWIIEPTVGRTDYWADVCTFNGVNFPLIEYHDACTEPCRMQEKRVWYDAERDPLVYWELVAEQKSLTPFGKRPVFTYLHGDDWGPLFCASRSFMRRTARFLVTRLKAAGSAAVGRRSSEG